jgi:hypothetical protein
MTPATDFSRRSFFSLFLNSFRRRSPYWLVIILRFEFLTFKLAPLCLFLASYAFINCAINQKTIFNVCLNFSSEPKTFTLCTAKLLRLFPDRISYSNPRAFCVSLWSLWRTQTFSRCKRWREPFDEMSENVRATTKGELMKISAETQPFDVVAPLEENVDLIKLKSAVRLHRHLLSSIAITSC